jgi:hypothetical protein
VALLIEESLDELQVKVKFTLEQATKVLGGVEV